jgi:hypothetical protein
MTAYFFIKGYNPAYDYFLTRYFGKKAIDFEDSTSFQELRKRIVAPSNPQQDSDEFLLNYLKDWRLHPEVRPSFDYFLSKIFDDGRLTLERLEALQSELPPSKGRLIFSQQEVAADMFSYYKTTVREPLRTAIARRAPVLRLLDYFSYDDNDALPQSRGVDRRQFEKAVKIKARELLGWLDTVSPETVNEDIASVLLRHAEDGHNMVPVGEVSEVGSSSLRCEHDSRLVQLRCTQKLNDLEERWTLQPARGYGLIEDGWKEIMFPRFRVIKKQDK